MIALAMLLGETSAAYEAGRSTGRTFIYILLGIIVLSWIIKRMRGSED